MGRERSLLSKMETRRIRRGSPTTRLRPRKGVFTLVLVAFPLFLSVDLENFSRGLDITITAWKVLSALILVFLYIRRLAGRKPVAAHILPMAVIVFMLLFSTLVNAGSLERYFVVWGGFFAVSLLVETQILERPLQLLLALKIVLGLIVLINFATVLMKPDGLWSNETENFWFLGHRNNFGTPLIAALVVGAAYDFISRRRLSISTLIIAVASFFSVVITWSASSVVAVVLAIVATLLVFFGKGFRTPKPFLLLALYVLADIGIVVFRIQEVAAEFLGSVLDRSADLTGRTRIWDIVFDMIRESPFWGHGVQRAENNGLTIYDPNFVHAHNGELDILMQGGLFTFIPFAILVCLAARKAARNYRNPAVQILFIGLILVMVRGITGLFFSSYAVLLLFLLLNSQAIAQKAHEFTAHKGAASPLRATGRRAA